MSITVIAFIVIPLVLFMLGAAAAGVRGVIQFTRYVARSEQTQNAVAESLNKVAGQLGQFVDKMTEAQAQQDTRLAVLEYEAGWRHRPPGMAGDK